MREAYRILEEALGEAFGEPNVFLVITGSLEKYEDDCDVVVKARPMAEEEIIDIVAIYNIDLDRLRKALKEMDDFDLSLLYARVTAVDQKIKRAIVYFDESEDFAFCVVYC